MRVCAALWLAAVVTAAAASAQQITAEPQLLFNQHLYYGTFSKPRGIAFDPVQNEIWVADTGNGLIGIYRPDGAELFSFASKEFLRDPVRVAIAPGGGVVVIEGDRTHVRRFDYRGTYKGDVALAGVGEKPIFGAVTYDSSGNLYVADNKSAQMFVYAPDGKLRRQFGSRGTDEGQFQSVCGIAVDGDGTIYVADQQAIAVQARDGRRQRLASFRDRPRRPRPRPGDRRVAASGEDLLDRRKAAGPVRRPR